jgi:hypothetical protein
LIWLRRILAVCVGIVAALASFALMMAAGMALAFHYFGDLGWFGLGLLLPIAACGSLIPGFFAALFAYPRLRPPGKTSPSH